MTGEEVISPRRENLPLGAIIASLLIALLGKKEERPPLRHPPTGGDGSTDTDEVSRFENEGGFVPA